MKQEAQNRYYENINPIFSLLKKRKKKNEP